MGRNVFDIAPWHLAHVYQQWRESHYTPVAMHESYLVSKDTSESCIGSGVVVGDRETRLLAIGKHVPLLSLHNYQYCLQPNFTICLIWTRF